MALSSATKTKIITHLGWAAKTLVVGSTHYNNLIAARLENLTAEIESLVNAKVSAIDTINAKLISSQGKAGLKRIGDIEFFEGGQAFTDLKNERGRLLNELSDMLDIEKVKSGGVNVNVVV